jgi:hypothetical protein
LQQQQRLSSGSATGDEALDVVATAQAMLEGIRSIHALIVVETIEAYFLTDEREYEYV